MATLSNTIKPTNVLTATSTAWVSYRQALRDVPSQQGFPWSVVWPTEPNS